jgi:hypothetical protein
MTEKSTTGGSHDEGSRSGYGGSSWNDLSRYLSHVLVVPREDADGWKPRFTDLGFRVVKASKATLFGLAGGSWSNRSQSLRVSCRFWYLPVNQGYFLGFRCVRKRTD